MQIYIMTSDDGIDSESANEAIKQINNCKSPVIHMKSIGGEWGDGMAIYDAIQFSQNPTIIGHGYLCSMGTILLQAAPKRYLMPNCDLIVHFGSLSLDGHQVAVESANRYYTKVKNNMIDIYADRCVNGPFFVDRGYSRSKTRAYIKRKLESNVDWYLNSEEAIHYGFADKVLTKEEYAKCLKS